MLVLGICASYGLHVCLIENGVSLFNYSNNTELKSDNLLSVIDDALKQNAKTFSDVDVVATCVGPGSFTGSRVAISLVKGLLVGQNKKIVAFESFDCFGDEDVVLSGFGNFVYLKKGDKKDCVESSTIKKFKGVTDSEDLAEKLGIKVASFNMQNVINKKVEAGDFVTIHDLMPVYLRASQAEIEREKKNVRR